MTANIINLRKARKAHKRADKDKLAAHNRVAFGRTRTEREQAAKVRGIERARLDGSRIAPPGDDDSDPGAVS